MIIRFKHPQTGAERVGAFTRAFPEHNAIGVYVFGHREVVVHLSNVVTVA